MARRSSSGTGRVGLQPPSMASLPDMYSCWKSYWALQLWLLCVLSTLQLSWTALSWNECIKISKGFVTDTVGNLGLMPNLTVICDHEREVAHLNFSTGGNIVNSVRAAQECTILSTNETIFDQDRESIYSKSTSKQHQQWSISPPHDHLNDSDIECHYFGCYYIDTFHEEYDYDGIIDIVLLPNATCTFSQLVNTTPSSSLTISPTGNSTLSIVATSVSQSVSTTSTTSISTSISTVPSQSSSGNIKSEWIILTALMIALLVISVITFISCLLFISKRYFNSSIKQGIYYYDPNEPLDKKFTPVDIKLSLSPSLSGISTSTKLDQLHENEENFNELESILNMPTESTEFSLAIETSTDPSESDDKDRQDYEPSNNNSMQRRTQSDSEHNYLTDTTRIANGIAGDEHEISIFDLDTEYSYNGLPEPIMDGSINIGQLSEASTPIVDTHTPDMSHMTHLNYETQSERLSNGYVHCKNMHSAQEESSSMIDDLSYDLEPMTIIPLDDLGPIEQKLDDTSGYVSNDQFNAAHGCTSVS